MDKLWALLQRTLGTVRHHIGTDQFGNKYYYVPEQRSWTAWIRGKRKNPPTVEEILQNEKSREEIKMKVEEGLRRDTLSEAAEYRDGLVTQIKGHAAAPQFGKHVPSQEPVSTANTFQPGSWAPQGAANQKK
ncbi:hypothetical protein XENTR_v10002903 [Xenopus tropicalis]|nr:hypothetical protein XENTR_v10002903 [Xenopus tropicalis]